MCDMQARRLRQIKNTFTQRFAEIMETRLDYWLSIQSEKRKSLYSRNSILTYLGTGLLGFMPGKNEREYHLETHVILSIIFFISAIVTNIQLTNKNYQNAVKGTFFSELIKVFGDQIHYASTDTSELFNGLSDSFLANNLSVVSDIITEVEDYQSIYGYRIPNAIFEASKLFNRTIMTREDDDVFYGNYNDVDFIIDETDFGWEEQNKYHTYHSMFKGIAMHFKLNKSIRNRVLIKSKNLIKRVPKGYEKVDFEYEKFNKDYEVYVDTCFGGSSAGQIEARYLLNTAFLDRFMQLKTSFAVKKIECSIVGTDMLIFLSTKKDLFEMNHLLGRVDDITQYKHLFDEFASVLSFIDVLNLSSKTKL